MGFSDEKSGIRNIISPIILLANCLDIELSSIESPKRKALIDSPINAFLMVQPQVARMGFKAESSDVTSIVMVVIEVSAMVAGNEINVLRK